MRRKMEAVLCFESSDDGLPRIVRDYRARYRAVSQVLDDNPEILSAVHKDLQRLSEGDSTGREGDYTSENILRALIVQHTEGLLPGGGEVRRVGRAGGDAGDPATHAGLHGQGVGALAGLSRRDRGDYFRSETGISADSLFFSRV